MQNCCTRSVLILIIISSIYFPVAAQDSLHLSVPQKKMPNSLGVKYDLITFDNVVTKPWHLVSVEYTKHIKKTPLITRLNYANRFSKSGFQLEAEVYPALSKKYIPTSTQVIQTIGYCFQNTVRGFPCLLHYPQNLK